MTKTLTLRLPVEQAAELERVARVERTTVSDTIRDAIGESIERRRNDPEFRRRVHTILEEDRSILERLA